MIRQTQQYRSMLNYIKNCVYPHAKIAKSSIVYVYLAIDFYCFYWSN